MKHALDYKNTPRTIKYESSLADVLKKIIAEKKVWDFSLKKVSAK